jgi:hypothetical protein
VVALALGLLQNVSRFDSRTCLNRPRQVDHLLHVQKAKVASL